MNKTLQAAIVSALLMMGQGVAPPATAMAQESATQAYRIPAGDLDSALRQYAAQNKLQLVYPAELVKGKRSAGVSGTYTQSQALQRLLMGSGLQAQPINAKTIGLRPAQAPAPVERRGSTTRGGTDTAEEPTTLDTMTVTGTRIRGGSTPSPVITIGAERIQEEGFTDLGEVIRSVPQNFSGGQNPGVTSGAALGAAGNANQNITGGSSLNLRGLGPDATLTLLNGRRLSYGGFVQSVDIGAIPVEAVERIEIVADGASAIYGSDAVGGVGNVILKRDYEGITVGARYGGATDGGLTTREYTATAGANWSSGGLIAVYKDTSTDPIHATERDYTDYLVDPTTIYPGSDVRNGLASMHQSLGDAVELRVDALRTEREQRYYSYLASSNWDFYSRFTPKTTTTLVSPGIEFLLPNDWTLSVAGAWSKDERVQHESREFVETGVSTLWANNCYCNESRTYEIGAEGPLFALGGRDARLAVGAGYRVNDFLHTDYMTDAVTTQGDESSRFAYAEINLPLIGPDSNIAGAQRLEFTAAMRGEDYDTFGSVTTPKLGLVYGPSADFTLKTSWGKSFKTPTLLQRNTTLFAYLHPPSFFGGEGYAEDATLLWNWGGNPDLGPERARTWTASLAFHPQVLPGLEAELSWFDIDYTDRVVEPITNYSQAMSLPVYEELIHYSPTPEEQAAFIADADSFVNSIDLPYDPSNVVAIIYNQYRNVDRQQIRGLDLSGSYRFDLGNGQLTIRSAATWLDMSQRTTSAEQDSQGLSGTLFNPAKIKSRLGAIWNQGGFTASAFANYAAGVRDTVNDEKGSSFTTFDATLRYATGQRGDAWPGLEFALAAQNLFDRAPPFHTHGNINRVPYDSTNYSAVGRFLSLSVSKHW